MRDGKLSEPIFKRSVLRQLNMKCRGQAVSADDGMSGAAAGAAATTATTATTATAAVPAGIGRDAGIIRLYGDNFLAAASCAYTVHSQKAAWYAVCCAANRVAAAGAKPTAVMLSVLLPEDFEEKDLKAMMCTVKTACTQLHIEPAGADIEVSPSVNAPVFQTTAYGSLDRQTMDRLCGAKAGQDLVVTKQIGLEGTAILAAEQEEKLLKRYTEAFIYQAQAFSEYASVLNEAAAALKHGATAMHTIQQGGILGALWELAEASGAGLEADLKKIPIKQETVEICEFFTYNPYQLLSGGSLLIAAEDGFGLVRALEREHIPAAVIGRLTDGNDRVILKDDERRFIELPQMDEIWKRRD